MHINQHEVDFLVTIFTRTVIIYLLLIISMRLMGKRQIGELEISDLVTTLLISEIASLPITDNSIPLSHAVIPILSLVTFEVISSYMLVCFPSLKNIFSERPTVLINKGKTDRRAMRSARISADELISELRQKGITDMDEVEYAILEQTGKISVVQKEAYKPATAKQLKIKTQECGISHIVVCEGTINKNSLKRLSLTKKDIMKELKDSSVELREVYIMLINDRGESKIIRKDG